jgi:branched-subunit amino acid aminotransferase/4-amino-4-deoxychorismate lyase
MSAPTDVVVYLRERFVAPQDAVVSIFDRGYTLGDSVFSTMRAYEGVVFRLREHILRLEAAAGALGISLPKSAAELSSIVAQALDRLGKPEAVVRVTLSRGEGPLGVSSSGCDRPVLSVIARPYHGYPDEAYRDGIASMVVRVRKIPAECLEPAHKTGNYLSAVLARRQLEASGMVEGVQLAMDGAVVSGSISNVFLVKGGRLCTPDTASGCRPGVTREAILREAAALGIEVAEQRLVVADLEGADEVFFANTVMECLPVKSIGATSYAPAPGAYTRGIHDALRARIRHEVRGKA